MESNLRASYGDEMQRLMNQLTSFPDANPDTVNAFLGRASDIQSRMEKLSQLVPFDLANAIDASDHDRVVDVLTMYGVWLDEMVYFSQDCATALNTMLDQIDNN